MIRTSFADPWSVRRDGTMDDQASGPHSVPYGAVLRESRSANAPARHESGSVPGRRSDLPEVSVNAATAVQ